MLRASTQYTLTPDDIRAMREAVRIRVTLTADGYALMADCRLSENPANYSKTEWRLFPDHTTDYAGRLCLFRRIEVSGDAYDHTFNPNDEWSYHFTTADADIPYGPDLLSRILRKGDKLRVTVNYDNFTRNGRKLHSEWVTLHVERVIRKDEKWDWFSFQPINNQRRDWAQDVSDFERNPAQHLGQAEGAR